MGEGGGGKAGGQLFVLVFCGVVQFCCDGCGGGVEDELSVDEGGEYTSVQQLLGFGSCRVGIKHNQISEIAIGEDAFLLLTEFGEGGRLGVGVEGFGDGKLFLGLEGLGGGFVLAGGGGVEPAEGIDGLDGVVCAEG